MTYHYLEEVVPETIFTNVVPPRLAVLVEGGLEGQRHLIQQFIEDGGHGGMLCSPWPENPNWPIRGTSLLDTPKQQPGTRQEVSVCNFVQEPDSGVVCDPRTEVEERKPVRGAVTGWGKCGIQENPKGHPGYEIRQPKVKEPVDLRNGFGNGHATTHRVESKRQDDRRVVGTLME
jgi:hypothetical protein